MFANRTALTSDKASVVAMATLALHSNLRLKSKQSYTSKGPLDEMVMGNG